MCRCTKRMYVISTIVAIKRRYILKEYLKTFYVDNVDSVERYYKDGEEPEAEAVR